jgi:trigger factor
VRPANEGDLVSFKLSARRAQPEEGEPEMLIEETPYQLVAGENEEDEDTTFPYEGFPKELIGLSENETKNVAHTFDEESPYENLRGKEANFTIVVQGVKELHLPELTDEFAQSLGDFETMDALRGRAGENQIPAAPAG